jgi:hypothetical protein
MGEKVFRREKWSNAAVIFLIYVVLLSLLKD